MGKQRTDEPPPTTAARLAELVGAVTEADLAEFDARVAAKQAEIDQLLAGHRAELAGLAALRAVVAKRLGVEPPKKPARKPRASRAAAEPGANGSGMGAARDALLVARRRMVARLLGSSGPLPAMQIANRCDIPTGSITSVVGSCPEYFERCDQGYRLTALGRKELLETGG